MADNPLDTPIAEAIEKERSRHWAMQPSFLNMDGVNLKQAAAVVATSPFLDLRGFFNFKMIVNVTADTITTGAFKITLEEFDPSDILDSNASPTAILSADLLTGIDSTQNGQKEVLLFGATITPAKYSSGGGTGATLGTNLERFSMIFVGRLKLEITTQASGTSASASVHFFAGD